MITAFSKIVFNHSITFTSIDFYSRSPGIGIVRLYSRQSSAQFYALWQGIKITPRACLRALLLDLIAFGTPSYITAIRTVSPAPMLSVVVAALFLPEKSLPDP